MLLPFPDVNWSIVERLGGWAVVVWIVGWMRAAITRMIEAAEANMRLALEEFKEFRLQELEQHKRLEDRQDEILELVRRRRG